MLIPKHGWICRQGWISEAVLDVFASEPLPADSPLWAADRLHITPHNAALSAPYVGPPHSTLYPLRCGLRLTMRLTLRLTLPCSNLTLRWPAERTLRRYSCRTSSGTPVAGHLNTLWIGTVATSGHQPQYTVECTGVL